MTIHHINITQLPRAPGNTIAALNLAQYGAKTKPLEPNRQLINIICKRARLELMPLESTNG